MRKVDIALRLMICDYSTTRRWLGSVLIYKLVLRISALFEILTVANDISEEFVETVVNSVGLLVCRCWLGLAYTPRVEHWVT